MTSAPRSRRPPCACGRSSSTERSGPGQPSERALMHETSDDLRALQRVLDESFAAAGPHLLEVITPERRLTADQLAHMLVGMRLLVLATVTADGRPVCGPVDGVFYRGAFYFGS